MKNLYVAAGALLLGTSAFAWGADRGVASQNPVGAVIAEKTIKSLDAEKQAPVDKYADARWSSSADSDAGPAASSAEPIDKSALGDAVSAKLEAGDYAEWSGDAARAKRALAGAKPHPLGDGTQTAMVGKNDGPDSAETRLGGPIEASSTLTASLEPRLAAGNYPPCDPGPGDDNCIQLYEPGVRAQLASWNAPTGGLADGSATTAMGGPYEPVAGHAAASATGAMGSDAAMNDRIIDTSVAEPQGVPLGSAETGGLAPDSAEPDIDARYQGVGGPVVSQSGYPPCDPSPGDDRCIQLYERGVTGAGN